MVDIVNIAEEPWCKKFGKTMKKGFKVCAARRRISRDILQRLASRQRSLHEKCYCERKNTCADVRLRASLL